MLLCRGRAECCIFPPWGSCCQPFPSPLLCSGQLPCPGSPRVAGRCGYGNSSTAFSWLHMAQLDWVTLPRATQPSWPMWGWGVLRDLAWGWHWTQSEASLMSHRPPVGRRIWRNFSGFLPCFKPPYTGRCHEVRGMNLSCSNPSRNKAGSLSRQSGWDSWGTGQITNTATHYHLRPRVEMMDISQIRSFPQAIVCPNSKLFYTGVVAESLLLAGTVHHSHWKQRHHSHCILFSAFTGTQCASNCTNRDEGPVLSLMKSPSQT